MRLQAGTGSPMKPTTRSPGPSQPSSPLKCTSRWYQTDLLRAQGDGSVSLQSELSLPGALTARSSTSARPAMLRQGPIADQNSQASANLEQPPSALPAAPSTAATAALDDSAHLFLADQVRGQLHCPYAQPCRGYCSRNLVDTA